MKFRLIFVITVFLTFFAAKVALGQGGAPQPPRLISPDNGTTLTNANFSLCAQDSDGTATQIEFEIFQGPVDDFQTPWQDAKGKDVSVCSPPRNWRNGHYTWHAVAKNNAAVSGSSGDWTFTVKADDSPPPTRVPGPQEPTAIFEPGPNFDWSFDPSGGTTIGQTVTIRINVNSANPGATTVTVPCGGTDQVENTSGHFDSHWNTSGLWIWKPNSKSLRKKR